MNLRLELICFSVLVLLLCGCAGYRVGPTNNEIAGARSIQINPFRNETLEPRLVEAVGTALRRTMQQDGTYQLNSRGNADIEVSGVITDYLRAGVSFEPHDVITPRDFQITIVARVTAVERNTGRSILERNVTGRTTLRGGADLTRAEMQAVPLLAQDLARNVTSLLVDGAW
jgi:hypothetical protein